MLLKITPTLQNGQTGKTEAVETDSMDVECKQCAHYVKGTDVFKFFVITKMETNDEIS